MRKISLASVGLLVVGCASIDYASLQPGPKPDVASSKLAIKQYFEEVAFDPEAVRYRNWGDFFKMQYTPGLRAVPAWGLCVEVNAKNRMGGYVGYELYRAAFDHGELQFVTDSLATSECEDGATNPLRK